MTLNKQGLKWQIGILGYLILGIANLSNAEYTLAQVTPDGTTNTVVDTKDNNFNINQGDRAGNNLFHSFTDFSLPNGGIASFNNQADIVNIFSRVTGGNISDINGLISANGNANLFIINPAGIIFGENASLNIGGSFYGSSASSILFEDAEFSAADLENPPLLTINVPTGLGFQDNAEDVVNRSNFGLTTTILDSEINPIFENPIFEGREFTLQEIAGLEVATNQTIALIGGNVILENSAGITALGGNIELGGLSQAGDITLNEDGSLSFPEEVTRGNVILTEQAKVQVAADGGGSININARNLELSEESELYAGITEGMGSPNAQAGDITINATESVRLLGNPRQTPFDFSLPLIDLLFIEREVSTGIRNTVGVSSIRRNDGSSQSIAVGNAGNININSPILELSQVAVIDTSVFGSGNGGDIVINSVDSVVLDQGVFLSQVRGFDEFVIRESGSGDAGNISINTNSLLLTDIAFVLADVQQGATGNGGDIVIQAADNFTQNQDSFILTQLGNRNTGSAGDIEITAGSYEIAARTVLPALQSDISFGSIGDAGNITINVDNDFSISDNLILAQLQRGATGNAGDISITANNISLDNFALVSSNAASGSSGTTGSVTLDANNTISISNGAVVDALTENEFDGGNITVNAQDLNILSGGKIITGSENIGDAGNINLNIRENLVINNQNSPDDSPFDEPILQNIELQTGLFANTFPGATSNGGNISINAQSIDLQDRGSISAETTSGSGGNINLIVSDTIFMRNNSLISAQAFNEADGGNLAIDSRFIIAFPSSGDGSDIIANAERGNGGNININAKSLFGIEERPNNPNTNDINASSEFGLDGVVKIDTPEINPNQGLRELPTTFAVPKPLQGCQASREKNSSSFINTGRGGLPPNPYESLDNSNMFVDVQLPSKWTEDSAANASTSTKTETIVEADKWVVNKNGNVELVAHNDLDTTVWECGDP